MAVKTLNTLKRVIEALCKQQIHALLFGNQTLTVTAVHLFTDGRTRKKLWKQLQDEGYLSADTPDVRPTQAVMTFKAFEDYYIPAGEPDLAARYTFDPWRDYEAQGHAFVCWDDLKLPQQATIVGRLQRDPTSFTLLAYDRYKGASVVHTAPLGELRKAVEAAGGWNRAVLAVTNAAVKAKREAAVAEYYKTELLAQGLNWYLCQTWVFEEEESLPITARQPMPGSGFGMPRKPEEWPKAVPDAIKSTEERPKAVPDAIKSTEERINSLQQRLILLKRLEAYAISLGGWTTFLDNYEKAILARVRDAAERGELARGVR